jgi:hypothetical protein
MTQNNKIYTPKWQKEAVENIEEISGCMRPERVSKWPNAMTAT